MIEYKRKKWKNEIIEILKENRTKYKFSEENYFELVNNLSKDEKTSITLNNIPQKLKYRFEEIGQKYNNIKFEYEDKNILFDYLEMDVIISISK